MKNNGGGRSTSYSLAKIDVALAAATSSNATSGEQIAKDIRRASRPLHVQHYRLTLFAPHIK